MTTHRTIAAVIACAAIALLAAACAPSAAPADEITGTDVPPAETQTSPAQDPAVTPTVEAQTVPDDLQQIDPTLMLTKEALMPRMTAEPGAEGSVPEDVLASLKADAASKAGVDASLVEVISAQAVVWNDGSLGCPKPGVMYTQALVPGYQVILKAGDIQYNYHVAQSGSFVECRPSLKSPRAPVSPGDPTQ